MIYSGEVREGEDKMCFIVPFIVDVIESRHDGVKTFIAMKDVEGLLKEPVDLECGAPTCN